MKDSIDRSVTSQSNNRDPLPAEARAASLAHHVFNTPEGSELLDYLVDHFGVLNRVFVRDRDGNVDAIRGGIRDGERAAICYLMKLIKRGGGDKGAKKITLPLP